MERSSRVRVSPALLVSIVALILAAGGTSLANAPVGFVAGTLGLSAKQKKQVRSIADKEIANGARKLSVRFASSAGTAASASYAATAGSATNAGHSSTADSATNASDLGGSPPSSYESSVLAPGQTETGIYSVGSQATGAFDAGAIAFDPPVATGVPHDEYLAPGTPGTAQCPGVGHAAAGYLCVYSSVSSGTTFAGMYKPSSPSAGGVDPGGTAIYFTATEVGSYNRGVWAVTG
jgi:hypothetical protein